MTQPPPYLGHAGADSPGFGATTVSGTPNNSAGGFTIPNGIAPPPGPDAPPPAPSPSAAAHRVAAKPPRVRGPRRARLQLRHIDPWTVLKFSCVLSIALFFVWLIVVGVLYGVLDASGAISKVNSTVTTINGSGSRAPVTSGIVFGGAAIVGVINVVLFIALSTIGSLIYNLCADLVGGIEVTLSER
ncbi:MAG: DUF3566 domain-containing protein [Actinomycetota bacterium]|nr:DUF3566 domain-containing protein [Actinomycetota bacterium]